MEFLKLPTVTSQTDFKNKNNRISHNRLSSNSGFTDTSGVRRMRRNNDGTASAFDGTDFALSSNGET